MLRIYIEADRGYPRWLASHPDGFVVITERKFGRGDLDPDRPMEDIAERKLGSGRVVLHRATCRTVTSLGDQYVKTCGTRDDLEQHFKDRTDIQFCRICL